MKETTELKCSVFPSGTTSFHVFKTGAEIGDKCQCGRARHGYTATENDLSEMSEVLKWASENVVLYRQGSRWTVKNIHSLKSYREPTLYEALKKAWENREGK